MSSVLAGSRARGPLRAARIDAADGGGDYLRKLRGTRGLSALQLAHRLSVTPGTVHRWERRERLPGPRHVVALAEVLEVPTRQVARFFDEARTPSAPISGLPGYALRELRLGRGLTAAQVAAGLPVPAHTIYNWERGGCRIPLNLLDQLAHVLDVHPKWLVVALRGGGVVRRPRTRHVSPMALMRIRMGISQAAAAERMGVSRSLLGQWERGGRPNLFAIRAAASLYAVSPSQVARASGVTLPRELDLATWASGQLPAILRVLRHWSGITKRALAERCGAAVDTVRAWENGRTQPSCNFRRHLEHLYRLPTDALLAAYAKSETESLVRRSCATDRRDVSETGRVNLAVCAPWPIRRPDTGHADAGVQKDEATGDLGPTGKHRAGNVGL